MNTTIILSIVILLTISTTIFLAKKLSKNKVVEDNSNVIPENTTSGAANLGEQLIWDRAAEAIDRLKNKIVSDNSKEQFNYTEGDQFDLAGKAIDKLNTRTETQWDKRINELSSHGNKYSNIEEIDTDNVFDPADTTPIEVVDNIDIVAADTLDPDYIEELAVEATKEFITLPLETVSKLISNKDNTSPIVDKGPNAVTIPTELKESLISNPIESIETEKQEILLEKMGKILESATPTKKPKIQDLVKNKARILEDKIKEADTKQKKTTKNDSTKNKGTKKNTRKTTAKKPVGKTKTRQTRKSNKTEV